jgi:hypothetical protein
MTKTLITLLTLLTLLISILLGTIYIGGILESETSVSELTIEQYINNSRYNMPLVSLSK